MILILDALLIGYLPGALIFRLPIGTRERRAGLSAEERIFWHVMLSVAWSLFVVFGLAALEQYRFTRLIWINAGLCALFAIAARGRLRYRGQAQRPSWTVMLPLMLIVLGLWRFFPPSEYIIGGKDPGTYMNEGIQIAQRGSLAIHDPVVAAVPAYARALFFPPSGNTDFYSNRFMGFFLQDPDTGQVMGQFPHLFPVSIAIGYGVDGLTGARLAVGVWALLGLLAAYFTGARLLGRGAALAAAILLSLNVIDVWFARYPNAECAMQALLFAAILAFARAHQDDDRFFAPVAGFFAGGLVFLRVDALLGIIALVTAGALTWLVTRTRLRAGFVLPLACCSVTGWLYLSGPMRGYFSLPQVWIGHLPVLLVTCAGFAILVGTITLAWLARRHVERVRSLVGLALTAIVFALAGYAWLLRAPGGLLTDYDAHALRDFAHFYLGGTSVVLGSVALVVALAGFAIVVHRALWRDPALVLTVIAFSVFFFYKIHVVPEHFWAARRFLPVILPGTLLFVCATAIGLSSSWRRWRLVRSAVGATFLCVLGWQYAVAAAPVMPHVEYAGMIPYLERLAADFDDRDLVLVEARDAGSDTHVLAVPLAYIYARNVLVLNSARPDKSLLHAFLDDALKKYRRVFFVGAGGTDLLSRHIHATSIAGEQKRVPEYESAVPVGPKKETAAYPSGVRYKDFDYGIYQLTTGEIADGPFTLDVGYRDDLYVLRFYAKETTETPDGPRTFRWTGRQSVIAIPGMTGREREVVLLMHDGGRPKQAPPASVEVYLSVACDQCEGKRLEARLGTTGVGSGFQPYRFAIPADLAARAASQDDPAQLRLVSSVWNPQQLVGGSDNRNLGVMVDRVDVH